MTKYQNRKQNTKQNFRDIVLPNITNACFFFENQKIYANRGRGFSKPALEIFLNLDEDDNSDIEQQTSANYELITSLFFDEENDFSRNSLTDVQKKRSNAGIQLRLFEIFLLEYHTTTNKYNSAN